MNGMLHLACLAFIVAGLDAFAFEKIALVDAWDFGNLFETESRDGTAKILDHVLLTGADTICWRTHSGAIPRYSSAHEDLDRLEAPFDRRRVPDGRAAQSWGRVWAMEPDGIRVAYEECAKRAQIKNHGVHVPFEDAHWQFSLLGTWNLEHPQYMCRNADGVVQMYHQSFAYPEVVKHRLDIAEEILDRGTQTLFLDVFRNGGWSMEIEYVKPNIDEWVRRHPDEKPPKWGSPKWNEWVDVASRGVYDYLKGLHELTRQRGARLIVNIDYLTDNDLGYFFSSRGLNWRRLVAEDIIDGLAVTGITADEKDPFGSIERRFGAVAAKVKASGKSVYFPILEYCFFKNRPSYNLVSKWAGVSSAEGVRRLLEIADRCQADGIIMECVDYGNYKPEICKVIREFMPGRKQTARVEWTKVVSDDGGRYVGWPTAIRTSKGEILAVYSGDRDGHVCPYGKVRLVRSTDGGETWSKPETICDGPIDDRDAGILELKNGDLVLFWFTSVAFHEDAYASYRKGHPEYEEVYRSIPDDRKRASLGSWARRSSDGGRTWSEPVRVPVMTPHGGVLLRDGRILVVGMHCGQVDGALPEDPNRAPRTIRVAESLDGGRSFHTVAEIPRGNIREHWSLCEPTGYESADGTLTALVRYERPPDGLDTKKHPTYPRHMLRSVSHDGGKSWSLMEKTDIDGFPPHVLRLRDGRLLCSYASRTPGREGIYAVLSSDDGKTWDSANEMLLRRFTISDIGYPSTVEDADGSLLTVYYGATAHGGPAALQATRWRLASK